MSFATITVEIAFATPPTATPTWTDVSSYVRAFSIRRGRQRALDRQEAGTATLTLNNNDRRFDPSYASGPYYPNVVPMRKVRISATFNSITYRLFTGYIERWPQQWEAQGKNAFVTVQAADGFKVLALAKLNATYSQELSSTRVTNVLNDVSWLVAERDIATGQTTVQAATLDKEPALNHLQTVVQSENGRMFIAGNGAFTFHDRHKALKSPYNTSQATFGDGGGTELPYVDLQLDYDDDQIWNDVRITRQGGVEQVAADTTSKNNYFLRTLERTGLLLTSDNEALSAAEWLLSHYKDPALRIASIDLRPESDDDLWPQALGRELGDRITVVRRPPGGGSISQENIIEGIEHTATMVPKAWKTRFRLSPAEAQTYWILGDATYSVLDSTTRLAY